MSPSPRGRFAAARARVRTGLCRGAPFRCKVGHSGPSNSPGSCLRGRPAAGRGAAAPRICGPVKEVRARTLTITGHSRDNPCSSGERRVSSRR
jgi:hypothetical protein